MITPPKKTIKDLLPIDMRVSMLQTSMNVSGNNFQGKKIPSRKLLVYAFDLYKGMIDQVLATEKNQIMVKKAKTQAVKSAEKLLMRVSKKQKKMKKSIKKSTKRR